MNNLFGFVQLRNYEQEMITEKELGRSENQAIRRSASWNSTETVLEIPGFSIVTPYNMSPISMLFLLWVISMNWAFCVKLLINLLKRTIFTSSSGASTSSSKQKGLGLTRKIAKSNGRSESNHQGYKH